MQGQTLFPNLLRSGAIGKLGCADTVLQITGVNDEGTHFTDRSGGALHLAADSVVVSSGFGPQPGFAEELTGLGVPASSIGDCVQPRKIFDAIHEAFTAAMRVSDDALEWVE